MTTKRIQPSPIGTIEEVVRDSVNHAVGLSVGASKHVVRLNLPWACLLTALAGALASTIDDSMPDCADKSAAIRMIREPVMTVNIGVALRMSPQGKISTDKGRAGHSGVIPSMRGNRSGRKSRMSRPTRTRIN